MTQEIPIEHVRNAEGDRSCDERWIEQAATIILQIVQLRDEVKAGVFAIEQLRTELLALHEQARDELARQAGETRQLILQTRQEMRVLQEHSVSRITSRLNQR